MSATHVTVTVRNPADKEHTREGLFPVEKIKILFHVSQQI